MDDSLTSTHYSILIGINFYQSEPLSSCVNDVQETERYLRNLPYLVHISVFSATSPTDPHGCSPTEDFQHWPTHGNVMAGFRNIISKVKALDFVHIHFSGHGTSLPPSSVNRNMGDVALVLLDGQNGNKIRYLRGIELARVINEIVQKGARVTLVLDCCFSGGASRGADLDSIRSLGYSAEIDTASPPLSEESVIVATNYTASRDGHIHNLRRMWATGVCGGIKHRNKKKYGALSYLLLESLDETANSLKTSQEIYQKLCATFRQKRPQQNPVLYGNTNLSFFGPLVSAPIASFAVSGPNSPGICLEGGQAHGVCIGDVFTLQPFGSRIESVANASDDPITARVVQTNAISSGLELINRIAGEVSASSSWTATVLSQASLQKYPVLISVPNYMASQWRQAAKKWPSLSIHIEDREGCFAFHITLDGDGLYKIKDKSSATIPNIPEIAQSHKSAVDELLGIVEHLARFKHVKAITNPNPTASFCNSFQVHVIKASGEKFSNDQIIRVHHNDKVTVELQNNNNQPLYLHIYNLAPGWEIEHLGKGGNLIALPTDRHNQLSGKTCMEIRMTVPRLLAKGLKQCMDIIKVFVTARPTTLNNLEMPRIGVSGKQDGIPHSLSILPGGTINAGPDDWLVLNFQFHTSL
ncbi:caspase domain-containing protein [Phaeosphaeriaceae sp. PMI808]|nr:caspase domain-containing protein [Phaeosphaeriaceae sp. PMI808]